MGPLSSNDRSNRTHLPIDLSCKHITPGMGAPHLFLFNWGFLRRLMASTGCDYSSNEQKAGKGRSVWVQHGGGCGNLIIRPAFFWNGCGSLWIETIHNGLCGLSSDKLFSSSCYIKIAGFKRKSIRDIEATNPIRAFSPIGRPRYHRKCTALRDQGTGQMQYYPLFHNPPLLKVC